MIYGWFLTSRNTHGATFFENHVAASMIQFSRNVRHVKPSSLPASEQSINTRGR